MTMTMSAITGSIEGLLLLVGTGSSHSGDCDVLNDTVGEGLFRVVTVRAALVAEVLSCGVVLTAGNQWRCLGTQ